MPPLRPQAASHHLGPSEPTPGAGQMAVRPAGSSVFQRRHVEALSGRAASLALPHNYPLSQGGRGDDRVPL